MTRGWCFQEMEKLLQQSGKQKEDFMPILVRPCAIDGLSISDYLVLPRDGQALSQKDLDAALLEVVREVSKVLEGMKE